MRLWLLLAARSFVAVVVASSPIIDTKYGQLEGFTTKLQDGTEAAVFLGVPYAQPPVDELRLEVSFNIRSLVCPQKRYVGGPLFLITCVGRFNIRNNLRVQKVRTFRVFLEFGFT